MIYNHHESKGRKLIADAASHIFQLARCDYKLKVTP